MAKVSRHISLSILGIALGILVASGCSNIVLPDKDALNALREAKSTEKDISVEGKVASEDGSPLVGINVQVIGFYYMDTQYFDGANYRELTSLSTDGSGIYRMPKTTVFPAFEDLKIIASDKNDIYVRDSVVVRNVKVGSVAPTIILKKK